MKKMILMTVAMLLTLGVSAETQSNRKKTESVVFVTNIHCDNCKRRIEDKIPFERGVKDLKVDIPSKKVTVWFDPSKTNADKIKKAIEDLGYKAEQERPSTEEPKETE